MSVAAGALLALVVLVGSSIPFVPTGEVVSGAAALTTGSVPGALAVYLVTLVTSVLGDTVMLLGTRLGARFAVRLPLQRLSARPRARQVRSAVRRVRSGVAGHALQSMLTGRLLPGGRAPVIIALGLARYPLRRFVPIDLAACAAWAAVYVALGAAGGHLGGAPVVGTAVAVGCAVALGLAVQLARRAHDRLRGDTDR